ncbi:hypothetical protein [Motilimonas pumila]|uniref:Uncharacterized protein n=1 Tax=Motilimonas pumila TaxID=2303987 RepID=A0A418YD25_9GAMM|nr:hypothetical protein [Motilimonas pumila]RJG42420.1 hypothetical protein D1Z90_13180 [Motilimonas pumila]
MQISSNTVNQSAISSYQTQNVANARSNAPAPAPIAPSKDTVSISAEARALNSSQPSQPPVQLPVEPKPDYSDQLQTYKDVKQTQLQYQVASDLVGVATGSGNGLSPASAYTLANNDEARESTVGLYAVNSQAELASDFIEQSTGTEEEETTQSTAQMNTTASTAAYMNNFA